MSTSQTEARTHDGHWSDELGAVRAELAAADHRVRSLVREQPLTVVLVALATGFVLGRIIRG